MMTKMKTGVKSSAAGTDFSLAIRSRFMMVEAHRLIHANLSFGVCRGTEVNIVKSEAITI